MPAKKAHPVIREIEAAVHAMLTKPVKGRTVLTESGQLIEVVGASITIEATAAGAKVRIGNIVRLAGSANVGTN